MAGGESSRPGLLASWIQHPRAARCVALEAGQIGRMVSVQPFLLPLARGRTGRDWSAQKSSGSRFLEQAKRREGVGSFPFSNAILRGLRFAITTSVEVTRPVETILVVDDEDHVRVVARGMLETKGYTVLDTGDPQMALHWVKSGVCFHLLLVDVVMARMKGTELANRLKTLSPQTKVLLMSGYVVSGVAGYPFIAKPFTGDQLAERVREVLTRPSPFARPRS